MNIISIRPGAARMVNGFSRACLLLSVLTIALSACSGSADPSMTPPPTVIAPTVTAVASQTVTVGQTATFTEAASGTAPLNYQWQKNGTAIAGATMSTYTTPATVAGDTGSTFVVVVSNSAGSATTAPATLTVTVPPTLTITQQPTSVTVASGAPASFTAAATCSSGATIAWQWQRSADGGATWTNISAATTTTYTLVTASTDNAAEFRAQAACSGLTATTSSATLTVTTTAPPSALNLTELTTGLAPAATLDDPAGLIIDGTGTAFVVDSGANLIKRVGVDGTVVTLAGGSLVLTGVDGTGYAASFHGPRGIALGADGNMYVTDSLNHTIRKVTPAGVVTTLAGAAGASGSTDGTGAAARFNVPFGITFGSDGALYVADSANFTIRRVTLAGVVSTIAGSAGTSGSADGSGTAARFGLPAAIVGDTAGALYLSDQANGTIRKITSAGATTTIAGNGSSTTASDGTGLMAGIPTPGGLVLSGSSLYIAAIGLVDSQYRGQVRRLDLSDNSVHTVTGAATFAVPQASPVDGGPATARFTFDYYSSMNIDSVNRTGLAVNSAGMIYLTSPGLLRTLDTNAVTTTILTSSVVAPPFGDGHTLPTASFGTGGTGALSFALDPQGNILVADGTFNTIRRVAAVPASSPRWPGLPDRPAPSQDLIRGSTIQAASRSWDRRVSPSIRPRLLGPVRSP